MTEKEYQEKFKRTEKFIEEELRQTMQSIEDCIRIEREIEKEEKGCRRLSLFLLVLFIVAIIIGRIIVQLP